MKDESYPERLLEELQTSRRRRTSACVRMNRTMQMPHETAADWIAIAGACSSAAAAVSACLQKELEYAEFLHEFAVAALVMASEAKSALPID